MVPIPGPTAHNGTKQLYSAHPAVSGNKSTAQDATTAELPDQVSSML